MQSLCCRTNYESHKAGRASRELLGLVLKGEILSGVIKDHQSGWNSGEAAMLLLGHLEIYWD